MVPFPFSVICIGFPLPFSVQFPLSVLFHFYCTRFETDSPTMKSQGFNRRTLHSFPLFDSLTKIAHSDVVDLSQNLDEFLVCRQSIAHRVRQVVVFVHREFFPSNLLWTCFWLKRFIRQASRDWTDRLMFRFANVGLSVLSLPICLILFLILNLILILIRTVSGHPEFVRS